MADMLKLFEKYHDFQNDSSLTLDFVRKVFAAFPNECLTLLVGEQRLIKSVCDPIGMYLPVAIWSVIVDLVQRDRKVEAIKELRARVDMPLKDAKDYVEYVPNWLV